MASALVLAAAAAGTGLIAGCKAMVPDTPQHGWSETRWGPLVPHHTFPGDCSLCHVPGRWDRLKDDFAFDHEKATGVALAGAHRHAACLRCHNDRGPVEVFVARGCGGCHVDPHESALGPGCTACHRQESWAPIGLVARHAATRFPLSGAHLGTPCDACHRQARIGDFRGAPVACHLCHQAALARASNPDHRANGWVRGCQRCHAPSRWSGGGFQHGFFVLTGAHAGANCKACHPGRRFRGTPRDCVGCHDDAYQNARNPDHVQGSFSRRCADCHDTAAWKPARFHHSAFFPLRGAHAGAACTACHRNAIYKGTPRDCYACHQAEYRQARNPAHGQGGFPTTCETCHTASAWRPSTFDHDPFFPIRSGHHAGFKCTDCHPGGNVRAFTCTDCHEHRRSKMDPEHRKVAGYRYSSADCLRCHPRGKE